MLRPYREFTHNLRYRLIYSKADARIDERKRYRIDELEQITSVVNNFQFFLQEKYRIALDRSGSGNTKNIGSVMEIE